ncbi:hypothetical protein ACWC0C_39235 [Streptomyces sp. NPDC001709]
MRTRSFIPRVVQLAVVYRPLVSVGTLAFLLGGGRGGGATMHGSQSCRWRTWEREA